MKGPCDLVIVHASQLLTIRGPGLGIIQDGAVAIEGGRIVRVGETSQVLREFEGEVIDAKGQVVMPGWVDPHTHLVFAGFRDREFEERMAGKRYEAIARAGGGILATVEATRRASEDELLATARQRLRRLVEWGTTTVEIKSGYGLSIEGELKILKVIKRLKEEGLINVIPTFLGAHAVPPELKRDEWISSLCESLIPEVAQRGLADFCDVFCDEVGFTQEESRTILISAQLHRLGLKVHADEFGSSGGAELAGELGACSADHLIYPSPKGLNSMARAKTVAVLLPGTSLFLRSTARPPVTEMRRLGLTLALGSDYNPGTCMCYQMPMIVGLGCMLYGLSLTEAIRGATINAAKAIGILEEVGSLEPGKLADLQILGLSNYRWIGYGWGENFVRMVVRRGRVVYAKDS